MDRLAPAGSRVAAAMSLMPGAWLGAYQIHSRIGAGGMGEVWRAHDPRLKRTVAVKTLPAEVADDPERLRRFANEAQAASALSHPNIVTIYDVGKTDGVSWIAMELVEGDSLRDLGAAGSLPWLRLLSIGAQLAEGLARAHDAGIIHRDLKPENVVVTSEGLVKILDFGIARLERPDEAADTRADTLARETRTGVVLGTVGYMSPEQATGRPLDFRSDQFALGAIIYEMAAGRRAFPGASAVEVLAAVVRDDPPPLASVRADTPPALARIVARALVKEPGDRYGSTRDLARDLREIENAVRAGTGAPSPAHRARRLPGAIALAALILLAAGGLWVMRTRPRAPTGAGRSSIAVLPFERIGGAAEEQYFADGITDSLTNELATVPGLLVISRDSAFRYRGKTADVRSVGTALGVRYVLEGSVQRAGGTLRVNARLVDASSGFQVWSDRYDRPEADLFAVQDEISRGIGSAMKLALVRPEHSPPAPSANRDAYEAYLKGIFFTGKEAWSEKDKGIPFLEKAVEFDPTFAEAWGRLAVEYSRRAFASDPTGEWEQKAFLASERTLALDPRSALAHLARGNAAWSVANGFPHERAAADFRRAIELNPNLGAAYSSLGSLYLHVGLLDRALDQYRRALRIDPLDRFALYRVQRIHLYQGRYAEALDGYEAHFPRDFQKLIALAHLGRVGEAQREIDRIREEAGSEWPADVASSIAVVCALSGRTALAEQGIQTAIAKGSGSSHFHHAEYNVATAYALMGRREDALRWLQKTASDGMPCYPLFASDTFLRGLRGNPDFDSWLAQMKSQWERFQKEL